MTTYNLKHLYKHFLKGHEGKLHFAAHSHHFWPDISRAAHLQYWDDCALSSDQKWDKIFGEIIPKAQTHVASILRLKDSKQIVFAPNTHELLTRVLSLFLGKKSLYILTTSSEFHSFRRQILRLSEIEQVKLDEVSTTSLLLNKEEFLGQLIQGLKKNPDIIFLSQVFFDSGFALNEDDIEILLSHKSEKTIFVLDGYHGFAALPFDLSRFEGQIFYLAGGYKYAQAGEGAAFLVVPKGDWRPANTGWFAEFGELSEPKGAKVGYTNDGLAFIGATQDYSGLYRLNAVWDLFQQQNIYVPEIHKTIRELQIHFIASLPHEFNNSQHLIPLFDPTLPYHGHFITYKAQNSTHALELEKNLRRHGIITDSRGDRLRFGFGLYQSKDDVDQLISLIRKIFLFGD